MPFSSLMPGMREGLVVAGRRSMLKAGLAGMAGLSLPGCLRAPRRGTGRRQAGRRQERDPAVDGGRSEPHRHLGPQARSAAARTAARSASSRPGCPGVIICEHLPKQAAMLDVHDHPLGRCPHSNHEPNKVFQTGNLEAAPRVNRSGDHYPAIGSIVAKHPRRRITRPCRPTSRS